MLYLPKTHTNKDRTKVYLSQSPQSRRGNLIYGLPVGDRQSITRLLPGVESGVIALGSDGCLIRNIRIQAEVFMIKFFKYPTNPAILLAIKKRSLCCAKGSIC